MISPSLYLRNGGLGMVHTEEDHGWRSQKTLTSFYTIYSLHIYEKNAFLLFSGNIWEFMLEMHVQELLKLLV